MRQISILLLAALLVATAALAFAADPEKIECRKCGTLNKATNAYCVKCGTALADPKKDDLTILPPKRPTLLEVGMSRVFHLRDRNVISGRVVEIIGDSIAVIATSDGKLNIPAVDILDETVDIVKADETHYSGPLLSEDDYSISVKTPYGVVVVLKKDIVTMDRYYGDRKVAWQEEKRRFYSAEELIDIFHDPTATPLQPSKVYLSGLSLGYGFTENFTLRTQFGPNFQGDLNLQPLLRIYHRSTGASELSLALGLRLFNRHLDQIEAERYSHWIINKATNRRMDHEEETGTEIRDILIEPDRKSFYWGAYMVMSRRQSLPSGRGKWGWHLGGMTNSLALAKPALLSPSQFEWDDKFTIPYRVWAAMDYDLTKQLKFLLEVFADNGHKFIDLDQTWNSYFDFGGTPFTIQNQTGNYQPVDLDFGFLWTVSETFRLGVHFQSPYFVFYWKW